jgi:acetyl esterase/lipase
MLRVQYSSGMARLGDCAAGCTVPLLKLSVPPCGWFGSRAGLIVVLLSLFFNSTILAQQPEIFENEVFTVRAIVLGGETPGFHSFSAIVVNRTDSARMFALDIRTEADGLGWTNWNRQFSYSLQPKEIRKIQAEYEIASPLLRRVIVRFGEAPKYYWRKELPAAATSGLAGFRKAVERYTLYLNQISEDRLTQIREQLPQVVKQSRTENPLRQRLRELFRVSQTRSVEYGFRTEAWLRDENNDHIESLFEKNGISAEPFSIASSDGTRISAFVAARRAGAEDAMPIIFLLTTNPPGVKESQAGTAVMFAKLGYRVVAVDRRITSRVLDTKAKFLTNHSDPVNDVLRLIDYFSDKFPRSKLGIMGGSAGAGEAKFVAALDARIAAAVLAYGVASNNSYFKDVAWVPVYSGMIIFPELGLGQPAIGKLSHEEFRANLAKLRPEHHGQARQVFQKEFPYFEDLDPLKVTPLIAPVPLLIVTGAQDGQFKPEGVVEVDQAVQKAYSSYGLRACSDLYIEPRTGHGIDATGGMIVAAFFERWLK